SRPLLGRPALLGGDDDCPLLPRADGARSARPLTVGAASRTVELDPRPRRRRTRGMKQRLTRLAQRARRAARKPPRELAYRVLREASQQADWYVAPARARRLGAEQLLDALDARTVDELWERLRARSYPAVTDPEGATAVAALE